MGLRLCATCSTRHGCQSFLNALETHPDHCRVDHRRLRGAGMLHVVVFPRRRFSAAPAKHWPHALGPHGSRCAGGVAVRWSWLVNGVLLLPRTKRVTPGRLLEAVSVVLMLQNALHHFAGQAFAIYQLGHRQRVGKSVIVSVLSMDQLAEATARLLVWGLLALFIGLPTWAAGGGVGRAGLGRGAVCGARGVFAWRHRDFQVERQPAQLQGWIRLRYHFAEWAHHLHGVRNLWILLAASGPGHDEEAGPRGRRVLRAAEPGRRLAAVCPAAGRGGLDLATMISITPGHLGIFEATLFFVYQHLGLQPTDAMILAIFDHLVLLLGAVLPGCVVSARWGFRLRAAASESDVPAEAEGVAAAPVRLSTRQDPATVVPGRIHLPANPLTGHSDRYVPQRD